MKIPAILRCNLKKAGTGILVPFLALFGYFMLCFVWANIIRTDNLLITAAVDISGLLIGLALLNTICKWTDGEKPDGNTLGYFALTTVVMAFAGLIAVNFLMNYVFYDESFAQYSQEIDNSKSTAATTFLTYFATIILAPIMEECLFRGLIFRYASEFNVLYGYVVNIGLFIWIHGTMMHIPVALAGGLVFTRLYHKSHDIRYDIAAHILYNLCSTVFSLLRYPAFVFSPWFFGVLSGFAIIMIVFVFFVWNMFEIKEKTGGS